MIQNLLRSFFYQQGQKMNNKNKMRKGYNFSQQMKHINQIIDVNVVFAQSCNKYLKEMWTPLIKRAVRELKDEYQEEFLYKEQNQDNQARYNAIKSSLNLVARQGVTNVDELFIQLAQEMNEYYSQSVNINKNVPYFYQCSYCKTKMSNTISGLKRHQKRCQANFEQKDNSVDHQNTKTKSSQIDIAVKHRVLNKNLHLKEKKLKKGIILNQLHSLKQTNDLQKIDQYFNKQFKQFSQSLRASKRNYSAKDQEDFSQNEKDFELQESIQDDDDFI